MTDDRVHLQTAGMPGFSGSIFRSEFVDSVRTILGGGAFRGLQALPVELAGCTVAMNVREALDITRRDSGADR